MCFRWMMFCGMFSQIDASVAELKQGKRVAYRVELTDDIYVSVTTPFRCVDIRRFFYPRGQRDMKATRQGLALKLSEWVQMADMIKTINQNHVFDN